MIIGASYLQLPLIRKARNLTLETHVFAWEDGAIAKSECHHFYPISIIERDKILEIAKSISPDGVISIASDLAAVTVNFIADKLNLTGNSMEATLQTTDKYIMRRKLKQHGFPCPDFWMFKSTDGLDPKAFDFPLVVKPTDRSGSRGVTKVDQPSELIPAVQRALTHSFGSQAIIEQYIPGREVSVEMISWQGRHFPLALTDKVTTGPPYFVEMEHHQPAMIDALRAKEIYQQVESALSCLGIRNGASHSELILAPDGKNVFVEIGGRMGGDCIGSDLVRLSTGYDFLKGVIEIAMGNFSGVKKTKNQYAGICYIDQPTGEISKIIDNTRAYPEIVKRELNAKQGEFITSVKESSDRSGYYIYAGKRKFAPSDPILGIEVG